MDVLSNLLDIQTILVFAAVLLALWLYRSTRLPSSFPPGPPPLPIVGNLFQVGTDPTESVKNFTKLKEQYGPVVGLRVGSGYAIVIGSAEVAKEALVEKAADFSNRPHSLYAFTEVWKIGGAVWGVLWANGDIWRQSRRFSLSSMRDFGVGKRSVEERIYDEAAAMCDAVAQTNGRPYDILKLTQQATSNIICTVCFGNRFEYTDQDFLRVLDAINYIGAAPFQTSIENIVPILRYLPFMGVVEKCQPYKRTIFNFIEKQIDQHRPTFDPNNTRDFVDLFLLKVSENKESNEIFSENNMLSIIRDVFMAGTETSSTSLRWLLLYMIHYPDIQRRCQEELDHVVGSGRHPTLADRPNLPYVDAVIHEMLRHGNVTPFTAPHATSNDTTLRGYRIPKDTTVLVNLYAINNDPVYWDDPSSYNPDRWLDPDGKLRKRESFMPFSTGARLCLGESLARTEIFVFFSQLIQRFTFSSVDPTNLPSLKGSLGLTLSPSRYELIAKAR